MRSALPLPCPACGLSVDGWADLRRHIRRCPKADPAAYGLRPRATPGGQP